MVHIRLPCSSNSNILKVGTYLLNYTASSTASM